MKEYRAALFDMDGVIMDSEPLHTLARERVFPRFGIPVEEERSIVLGAHKREYWAKFREKFSLDLTVDELVEVEFAEVLAVIKERNLPENPHLSELLAYLKNRGIDMAVCSSSSRSYVLGVLDFLGISDYFSVQVCGDEVECPKPAPDTYLIAAKKLCAPPELCFAVEDSRTGSLAAVAAGVFCFGYRGTAAAAKRTDFSACGYVVSDLCEIIEILNRKKR